LFLKGIQTASATWNPVRKRVEPVARSDLGEKKISMGVKKTRTEVREILFVKMQSEGAPGK